jgi:hypothetical protein
MYLGNVLPAFGRTLRDAAIKQSELREHYGFSLPKPGVRGSIPFRDASRNLPH